MGNYKRQPKNFHLRKNYEAQCQSLRKICGLLPISDISDYSDWDLLSRINECLILQKCTPMNAVELSRELK